MLTPEQEARKQRAEALVERGRKQGAEDRQRGLRAVPPPSDITDPVERILFLAGYAYGRSPSGSTIASV